MAARRGMTLLSNLVRLSATRVPRQLTTAYRPSTLQCTSHPVHTSSRLLSDKFTVINVQDESDFDKFVMKNPVPVVLDFHATWCGPCKILAPRLEQILSKRSKPVHLVKVDVDKFEDLAIKYRVQGVPAIFGVKDGKVVNKFVGVQDEDVIEGFVDNLVT